MDKVERCAGRGGEGGVHKVGKKGGSYERIVPVTVNHLMQAGCWMVNLQARTEMTRNMHAKIVAYFILQQGPYLTIHGEKILSFAFIYKKSNGTHGAIFNGRVRSVDETLAYVKSITLSKDIDSRFELMHKI